MPDLRSLLEYSYGVVGLRESGLTHEAIAAQTGLTRTGVFNTCRRFAARGVAGLRSGPRGPEPGTGRLLDTRQEATVRELVCRHAPDQLGGVTEDPMGVGGGRF